MVLGLKGGEQLVGIFVALSEGVAIVGQLQARVVDRAVLPDANEAAIQEGLEPDLAGDFYLEVVEFVVPELVCFEVEDEDFIVPDLQYQCLFGVQDAAGIDQPIEGMLKKELAVLVVMVNGISGESPQSDQHNAPSPVRAEVVHLQHFLFEFVLVPLRDNHISPIA